MGGPKLLVMILFIFTSATAPVAGIFFGAWLGDRDGVNEYRSLAEVDKGLALASKLSSVGMLFSVPVLFIQPHAAMQDSYAARSIGRVLGVVCCLWGLLFFGGACVPGTTCIFVAAVPLELRPLATSFGVVLFNLLGYF
eukprot:SAG31_NODE_20470_length_573_cov_1.143460_1_plen_138_part_01